MGFIEDGKGSGRLVGVNAQNRLETEALTIPLQHYTSHVLESAYQISNTINISTSKQPILLIQNGSVDKDISITYMRTQSASAADTNEDAFFSIEVGGQWGSGGTDLAPINLKVGSSNSAVGTFKGGTSIATTGTYVEIDRNNMANSMQTYSKEGSLVIPRNQSLIIYHTGSTVAGTAYCRVSFIVTEES